MTTEKKTRQIVLSERRPVIITDDAWPLIASADRFWGGSGHECQANEKAWIKVRENDDGRTIVYCCRYRGPGGMPLGYRGADGGYIVGVSGKRDADHDDQVVRAIRRCAGIIDAPELATECIADLPADDMTS